MDLLSRRQFRASDSTIAVGILFLAFALRLIYLNERGLWYDEAFSILYAARSLQEILAGTVTSVSGAAADVHPLFYYFSLHAWLQLAGESAFSARFYSVFYGIATIPIVYRLSRELLDTRVAIASALVLALAPFHLAYSQEARMYAQLGFWSMLAFFAFVRYRHTARKGWWVLFVIAGAGALYSHNLAFINFAALGLGVIYDTIRTRTTFFLRATVSAGLAMIALWLPWLVFVPSQLGKIEQAYWVPPPTLVTLIQMPIVFAFDFENAAFPRALFPIALFVAIMLPVFITLEIRRARDKHKIIFVALMAMLPIVLLFSFSQVRPVYVIRALMPAFLWYAILTAWALVTAPRLIRAVSAFALAALVVAILRPHYLYAEFPRSPFRETDRFLQNNLRGGDAIVHDNKLSFFPMYYYDRTLEQSFIADPTGAGSNTLAYPTQRSLQLYATTLDDATASKSRIWFVIFQQALDQAVQEGHPPANKYWMDLRFTQISLTRFNDLNVYLYQK